jgi:hypothetical protein
LGRRGAAAPRPRLATLAGLLFVGPSLQNILATASSWMTASALSTSQKSVVARMKREARNPGWALPD